MAWGWWWGTQCGPESLTLLRAPHFPVPNPSGRSCVTDSNLCVVQGRVWLAVMGDAEIYIYWFCMCDIRDDDDDCGGSIRAGDDVRRMIS